MSTQAEPLMDARDVASLIGVSIAWVYDHATRKEPRLRAVKLGKVGGKGLVKFRRQDVDEFIERCALKV